MDDIILSSSPQSVVSGYLHMKQQSQYCSTTMKPENNENESVSCCHNSDSTGTPLTESTAIEEFEQQIPNLIQIRQSILSSCNDHINSCDDPILQYMRHMHLDEWEYNRYTHFDFSRGYTRNLIGTDNKTYTLLLLCWTPGQSSPIHDHPCDGCWMKVLQGQINECRYIENRNSPITDTTDQSTLMCVQDLTAYEGDVIYMEDSMGLHKVGNPSLTIPAITLHLYCPPIKRCRVWCSEEQMFPKEVVLGNHSEFGQIL